MKSEADHIEFADLFSQQAAKYVDYRPRYPEQLFAWLAALAPDNELAWDCATGNGQAASSLKQYFSRVIATDGSAAQLRRMPQEHGIERYTALATASALPDQSVSLLTTAQALHWFHGPAFYKEALRLLKPGGILAAWGYYLNEISPEIDTEMEWFTESLVKPYASPRLQLLKQHYREIEFPITMVTIPQIPMETAWDLWQYLGYLSSWSAVQGYRQAKNEDPIPLIYDKLRPLWGEPGIKRRIKWPLAMAVGMKEPQASWYAAAGGVVVCNDEVLLLHWQSRKQFRLPKGHIETGELAADAAIREVAEESGIHGVEIITDLGIETVRFAMRRIDVARTEQFYLMRLTPEQRQSAAPSEPQYKPIWLPWEEAIARLTFANEQQWVEKAWHAAQRAAE